MIMKRGIGLSDRISYLILASVFIVILGVGVYAYGNPGTPTTLGHSTGELMPSCTGILTGTSGVANSWGCISVPPSCTGANQVLHWDGSVWSCATIPACPACTWTGWSTNTCESTGGTTYGGPFSDPSSCPVGTYYVEQESCSGGAITAYQYYCCYP